MQKCESSRVEGFERWVGGAGMTGFLLDGHEIGKIQTRSGRGRTEVLTIAGNVYVMGHDIDWLVSHEGKDGLNSATARSV
jgi:hypothetical protein